MRVGLEEAVDLFRKWRSEESLLRCDMSFPRFAATFRVRVVFVADDEIKLLSDDSFSEMALRLSTDCAFTYGEPRGFPEEVERFASSLVVSLAGDGEPDFIAFTEIIERP